MLLSLCVEGSETCSRWYILSLTPFGICGVYTVLLERNISSVVGEHAFLLLEGGCVIVLLPSCGGYGWPNADVRVSSTQWPLVSMRQVRSGSGFTLGFLESSGKSCWRDFSLSASCFVGF